jgi:hypothetical protein
LDSCVQELHMTRLSGHVQGCDWLLGFFDSLSCLLVQMFSLLQLRLLECIKTSSLLLIFGRLDCSHRSDYAAAHKSELVQSCLLDRKRVCFFGTISDAAASARMVVKRQRHLLQGIIVTVNGRHGQVSGSVHVRVATNVRVHGCCSWLSEAGAASMIGR